MADQVVRWLVCGGRDFDNEPFVFKVLDDLVVERGVPSVVITGGAKGADDAGYCWAWGRGIQTAVAEANWQQLGRRAGYIRNAAMLYLQPTLVIAFPGGRGTQMMVDLARNSMIEVIRAELV